MSQDLLIQKQKMFIYFFVFIIHVLLQFSLFIFYFCLFKNEFIFAFKRWIKNIKFLLKWFIFRKFLVYCFVLWIFFIFIFIFLSSKFQILLLWDWKKAITLLNMLPFGTFKFSISLFSLGTQSDIFIIIITAKYCGFKLLHLWWGSEQKFLFGFMFYIQLILTKAVICFCLLTIGLIN